MLLVIDNYDSFTYNLVHYFRALGVDTIVYRNDKITLESIESINPQHIVISPGPCTPNDAGISLDIVQHFINKIPILGVCLGHQAIAQSLGGRIIGAKKLMHGKTSMIYHNNSGIYKNIENPFVATRYHSLAVDQKVIPQDLQINAWTKGIEGNIEEIMGLEHKSAALIGLQFHPESILTTNGLNILSNFINLFSRESC